MIPEEEEEFLEEYVEHWENCFVKITNTNMINDDIDRYFISHVGVPHKVYFFSFDFEHSSMFSKEIKVDKNTYVFVSGGDLWMSFWINKENGKMYFGLQNSFEESPSEFEYCCSNLRTFFMAMSLHHEIYIKNYNFDLEAIEVVAKSNVKEMEMIYKKCNEKIIKMDKTLQEIPEKSLSLLLKL